MNKEKEVDYVATAAKWWADKLREYYRANKITRLPLDFDKAMKIDKFEELLRVFIQGEIDLRGTAYLKTGYTAMGILYDAADESYLDPIKGFPINTNMQVTRDDIIVSEGYKTEYRKVYRK